MAVCQVRFDVEEGDPGQYTIVLSQYDKTRDVSYTLNAYCTAPFRFAEAPPTPEKVAELKVGQPAITHPLPASLWPQPFMVVPPPSVMRCVYEQGTWDALTAGGRLGQSTFMHNPQFR